ncbi:MAG: transglycosylase SLT domain-containing protein [Bacteroidales bacterium]|jgi:membrane-bound lytic murein transglycosylase D|nr:transglycosylase SLT domain-containing protein [Bacteroidales bacterium]
MLRNLTKIFWALFLALPISLSANQLNSNDSIPAELFYSNFDRNLDSLMQIWYVQESIGSDSTISEFAEDEISYAKEFHDSIYIERLSRIPSLVHLTYNNIVRNYIHVYTIKKRDKLEVMLGLKEYYFPMFEEILDYYGLPLELKYLAVIESALNPRAVSRVGATGMWQFMLGTGRMYKLQVNSFVDERRDPYLSTHAAAKFLKDLYSVYNDWVLVIAAYNCGPGNVNKAIRRSGGKRTYWDIYPYLPRETRGYVPAYIGATYAMNYYKEHNLNPKFIDVPPVSDTIMINKNINLAQVSEILDIPIQLLRDLNPQYRREILPGNNAPCILRLPASYATRFIDMEDTICRHKADKYLSNTFRAIDPAGRSYVNTAGKDRVVHKIRNGESLGSIAMKYGVSTVSLKDWNNISGTKIIAGKNLIIYTNKAAAPKTASTSEKQTAQTAQAVSGNVSYYTVKDGDTLWGIAQQYSGISDKDIMQWNNLSRSKIQPGMKLKIMQ